VEFKYKTAIDDIASHQVPPENFGEVPKKLRKEFFNGAFSAKGQSRQMLTTS
jgi:hypothetical protein